MNQIFYKISKTLINFAFKYLNQSRWVHSSLQWSRKVKPNPENRRGKIEKKSAIFKRKISHENDTSVAANFNPTFCRQWAFEWYLGDDKQMRNGRAPRGTKFTSKNQRCKPPVKYINKIVFKNFEFFLSIDDQTSQKNRQNGPTKPGKTNTGLGTFALLGIAYEHNA